MNITALLLMLMFASAYEQAPSNPAETGLDPVKQNLLDNLHVVEEALGATSLFGCSAKPRITESVTESAICGFTVINSL